MTRYRVEVSPRAQADFREIRAWYKANLGAAAAVRVEKTILSAIKRLQSEPPLDRSRSDLPEGVFRCVARQHLVIFSCAGDSIRVLRILHGARELPAALDEE